MLRVQGYQPTLEYPLSAKEAMQNGKLFEGDTELALRETYGERLRSQVYLGNEMWSCKADFILDPDTEHPIIVEHKAQGEKWWNYNGGLPHEEHVIQVLLYRHLFHEMHGIYPKAILFYRAWSHYAELVIEPAEMGNHITRIEITGEMDNAPFKKIIALDPDAIRRGFEDYYTSNTLPAVFERKVEGLCTFRGRPSCPMYGHCWSDQLKN